jgi:hypothetical protein
VAINHVLTFARQLALVRRASRFTKQAGQRRFLSLILRAAISAPLGVGSSAPVAPAVAPPSIPTPARLLGCGEGGKLLR